MIVDKGKPTREIKVTVTMEDIARLVHPDWKDADIRDFAESLSLTHVDRAPRAPTGSIAALKDQHHHAVRICLLYSFKGDSFSAAEMIK